MSPTAPRIPVIVGAADLRGDGSEPCELIAQAAHNAVPAALLSALDAILIVGVLSWSYDDLPAEVARLVGAAPGHTLHSEVGGNQPLALIETAARLIAAGQIDAALVGGAESAASLARANKSGNPPAWSDRPGGPVRLPSSVRGTAEMLRYGIDRPLRNYPLFENALRAELGQSFEEAQRWSGEILAAMSEVAVRNPAAWKPRRLAPAEVYEATDGNRMTCWPYTVWMTANPKVDQGAAVVLCDLTTAREHGIPDERISHIWASAGAADSTDLLRRATFARSPGLSATLDACLDQARCTAQDLEHIDLYSCFPIVPKLAALHLGLGEERPLTVTGGLASFGGPANDYSLHAIVAAHRLRGRALVYANGEYLTKHHAMVIAPTMPPRPWAEPAHVPSEAAPVPGYVSAVTGRGRIETFTVEHDRDGTPARGWIIGRDDGARRFASVVTDPRSLHALADPDRQPIGAICDVTGADGLNTSTVPTT
ncbi:hypothetical protein [Frankia sp. CiP3]|uniref:hypothetical protein n=1 Tax=Frankia sp. CiP3 TaxID=2880971 RepID=UPI001EF5E6F9|nr:hypothetical protein [Frankia sp. CiP3]